MGHNIGTVQNCVALTPSVIATGSNVGRVVGVQQAGSLSGNHARDDMELEHNKGTPYVPTEATPQPDMKDGAATSAYAMESFWKTTLSSWDFTTVWEWKADNLPVLR